MKPLRLIPDGTEFPFIRLRRVCFPLSGLLSALSVVLFLTVGLNFGIDFTGGTLIELQAKSGRLDVAAVRVTAERLELGDAEVQEFGSAAEVGLRFPLQPGGEKGQQVVVEKARAAFDQDFTFRRVEVVGPRVSGELVQSGTIGVVLSIAAVLVYLWFRFEWQFAVGAVIATLHDLVLTFGFFAITRVEFNMTAIAAVLTIVGYSLNDTVVIFDRIRELLRKYKRMPIADLLDLSINTTLARTILVSVTTFLALTALVVFGGQVIQSFAYAMLFGVVVGSYSSIFIAAPVLIYLDVKSTDEAREPAAAPERASMAAAGGVAVKT